MRGSSRVPTKGRTSWSRIQESMTKRVPIRRTDGRSGSMSTGRIVVSVSATAKSVSSSVAVSGSAMPPSTVASTAPASSKGV